MHMMQQDELQDFKPQASSQLRQSDCPMSQRVDFETFRVDNGDLPTMGFSPILKSLHTFSMKAPML